jgi:hypothetical protein
MIYHIKTNKKHRFSFINKLLHGYDLNSHLRDCFNISNVKKTTEVGELVTLDELDKLADYWYKSKKVNPDRFYDLAELTVYIFTNSYSSIEYEFIGKIVIHTITKYKLMESKEFSKLVLAQLVQSKGTSPQISNLLLLGNYNDYWLNKVLDIIDNQEPTLQYVFITRGNLGKLINTRTHDITNKTINRIVKSYDMPKNTLISNLNNAQIVNYLTNGNQSVISYVEYRPFEYDRLRSLIRYMIGHGYIDLCNDYFKDELTTGEQTTINRKSSTYYLNKKKINTNFDELINIIINELTTEQKNKIIARLENVCH